MQKKTAFAKRDSYALFDAKRYPKLLLFMRISIISSVMLALSLHLSATVNTRAQDINNSEITFGSKNEYLGDALKRLSQETGYSIFYATEKVNRTKADINIEYKTRTVAQTLKLLLNHSELEYKQQGERTIILFSAEKPDPGADVPIIVSGRVLDEMGKPIAGVVVRRKSSSLGAAVTDQKGFYQVLITDEDESVIFTHLAYQTQTIKIKGQKSPFDVVLRDVVGTLDEVQVTAYGNTTKRLNTGDQTTINAKDLEKYPSGNFLVALQGSVPGLLVTQAGGAPGSTIRVNIRGINSVNAGSDPFYVIDGVPYAGGSFSSQRGNAVGTTSTQAYDAMSFLNPLDIESINILKDADATSMYGSRAANGVILITTKKGRAGVSKVDVNVFSGIREVSKKIRVLNTPQYLAMRREAKANENAAILPTDYDLNGTWDLNKYTDFADVFLGGSAHSSNAQVGISGGSNELQYLLSANYRNVSNLQKFAGGTDQNSSFHFSLNSNPQNRLSATLTGGFTYNKNNMPAVDLTTYIFNAPNSPELFNPNGTLNYENNTFLNPLQITRRIANSAIYNMTSSLVLNYRLSESFSLQTTLGYNRQTLDETLSVPTAALSPSNLALGAKGSSNFTDDNKMYWSIEPVLNYKSKIAKGKLTATAGWSLQKQSSDYQMLQATGYSSDLLLGSIVAGTAISSASLGVAFNEYKYNAVFGRVNYNWDEKYIINFSGRYDGSSRFGEKRQFHFFPAAGAAWLFSSEPFISQLMPFLSFGKLRASYGRTGNDQIGNNAYLTNYRLISGLPYQGIPGVNPSNLPNPRLSWETVNKANVGLDLKFLKDRISLEGNYYLNTTTDMITSTALPFVTGFSGISENQPSKLQNKGFDLSLDIVNINSSKFRWNTTLLFTRQRNKLLEFPGLTPAQQILLGEASDVRRVYRYAGVNPETGYYQFYNASGGVVNTPAATDMTAVVNQNPDYFGSVSNAFSYKGISLSFMFRYVKQRGRSVRGILAGGVYPGFANYNIPEQMLDRWQKPGDVATYQKFTTNINAVIQQGLFSNSDAAFGDASYIRLQNVALSYQVPANIINKIHLKGLRLYANGENLATISGYGVLDPENQSLLRFGPLRTIVFGIQASL